jgi:hypothetical protein
MNGFQEADHLLVIFSPSKLSFDNSHYKEKEELDEEGAPQDESR